MQGIMRLIGLFLFLVSIVPAPSPAAEGPWLRIARGVSHAPFARLLAAHRGPDGRVDYAAWRRDPAAVGELDRYLSTFACHDGPPADGREQMAGWINLYHASLARQILDQPRLASPKGDRGFFQEKRFLLGPVPFSLEDLSEGHITALLGWRARGILHLGCLGGPPLPEKPLETETIDSAIETNWRRWLASPDHLQVGPSVIRLSQIFLWYRGEFDAFGGFRQTLGRYLPPEQAALIQRKDVRVEYLPFDWTLAESARPAHSYTPGMLLRDRWWPWR
ncbi:MAG: hypothetical protein SFU85_10970 [Candidatus Methylacidiphilales bacterium]|nr:hypothetical protein [Candidatus Methylacidiphilales bacterium]